jgi:hypothetical protein
MRVGTRWTGVPILGGEYTRWNATDKARLALSLQECQAHRIDVAANQFWAPPMPRRASVTVGGFSMICENRTTVTMSSIDTDLP